MVEQPFWDRYPKRYACPGGVKRFWGGGFTSEDHEKWLDPTMFEITAFRNRIPRYKNKRGIDPQVQIFIDENHVTIESEWDLPTPNQDAAYKSLAKYGKATVVLKPDEISDLNRAWRWMERQFLPYMGDSKVVSVDEAIERLDMSTSSGCPFNEEFTIKRELFEGDPMIRDWLESDFDRLASDPLWTTIFSSSLKEELRPREKILDNSQRTFTAGAVDATVHGNRLFVDMNEKMYASQLKTASTIGMSPLKGNWDRLFRKLNIFPNGYALDESQYDSSIREFLMWGCAKFRWNCLAEEYKTPENWNRIRTYYRNLVNTLILTPEGVLLLKKLGNPSGSVNTVSDNTLILYWLLAYAWIRNAPAMLKTYSSFEDHTSKALLGDDNTWTVSDTAHEFYNAHTVIDVWKPLGITTTTDSMEARPAEDLDFLSAHTVFIGNVAVPLYDRNKLMRSLLFAPQLHITPETTLQRVTNLLMVGWVDLPFRRFCRQLIAWLIFKYDDVLCNDPRWIMAKSGIKSDDDLRALFTGRKYVLKPQSYQETKERCIKPDKEEMSTVTRRTKTRRTRRGVKGPLKRPARKVVAKKAIRQTRRKRPNRRRGRGGMNSRTALGIGGTRSSQLRPRSITVQNDEFIGAVTVANQPNFNNTAYAINPGQATTFPWLSLQAKQWEKYQFKMLEFYFKREVSEFATAGSAGKVIMSVDFDAADSPPGTKQQMEDTIPHVDGMPCENITMRLPPAQMHPMNSISKYVRPGGLPGNSDIKTYDVGNLNVATQGITQNVEVGELRVRYICVFSVPVLESTNSFPQNNQIALFQSTVADAEALTTATQHQALLVHSKFNGLQIVNTAGSFVPPSGNYLVSGLFNIAASGSNLVSANVQFWKNGADYLTDDIALFTSFGAETNLIMPLPPYFIQCNGTDAFTVQVEASFAAGTAIVYGILSFQAV
jgi:hypothetical protein